ncbi:MAG: ribose 5-phosphate isomerase B [Armatimonadetes bacterium]|nr:ribose 5-phosphate isomerase B [Armatimonadota bacterium]
MTFLLGSDHAGFALRRILANWLVDHGYAVSEFGATDESAFDYPDAAVEMSGRFAKGDGTFGVLVCGTGIGMAMAVNKFKGIRAAVCWNEDSARLSRQHTHANVLCLGGRLIPPEEAVKILEVFLSAEASRESRHVRRVGKIDKLGECKEPTIAYSE